MKVQDILFLIILAALIFKWNPRWFVWAGIMSLILSILLFYFWIFFTAERLTWYAAVFFLISILLNFKTIRH